MIQKPMQIWLDSADIEFIKTAVKTANVFGVTTNPNILTKVQKPIETISQEILAVQPGWLAVQVTAKTAAGMFKEAKKISRLSDRIIIKVPASAEGYKVMAELFNANIPVMATAIFDADQVLLSGFMNAIYVAPYMGRMAEARADYLTELQAMLNVLRYQKFSTKILAASIKEIEYVKLCEQMGIHAITLAPSIFSQLYFK